MTCIDKDNNKTKLSVEVDGSKPVTATITLENGKIITVTDMILNGFELKKKAEERLKIKDMVQDTTPAEVKVNINKITTNSITITVEAIDNQSGIREYLYSIDDKNYIKGNNTYKLQNLNSEEKYTIYVKVINGNDLETKESIEVTTLTIDAPIYNIDKKDWAQSKLVTIIYPIIDGQELVYEYSLDNGITWVSAIQIQEVLFESNGTLIAKVMDGTNAIVSNTLTINKIDTTAPSIVSISGNTSEWTEYKNIIINAEDSESGIKEYSFNNGVSWQTSNSKRIATNGIYKVQVKNNVGLISTETVIVSKIVKTITPVTSSTKTSAGKIPTGSFSKGDEYIINVDGQNLYHFYIIGVDGSNVNLMMDRNVCSNGTAATDSNKCLVAWSSSSGSNAYGPREALTYLHDSTKNWKNIPNIIVSYTDEGGKYGGVNTSGVVTKITAGDGSEVATFTNLKSRLITKSEIDSLGCTTEGTCPAYVVNALNSHSSYSSGTKDDISGINGYWSLSSYGLNNYRARSVYYTGGHNSYSILTNDSTGVRPVITIPKSRF